MHPRTRRLVHPFIILAAFAALSSALRAQVVFTFAGYDTADNQPVSLTFTTSPAFHSPDQPRVTINEENGGVTYSQYVWVQDYETNSPEILSAISGTPLTGAFVSGPTRVAGFGFDNNHTTGESIFIFVGQEGSEAGFGPLTPAGTPLRFFYGIIPVFGSFVMPAAGNGIDTYFSAYRGTYELEEPGLFMISDEPFGNGDGDYAMTIAITSVSINAAAPIPEPGTYAAVAGIVALGCAAYRRRRAA